MKKHNFIIFRSIMHVTLQVGEKLDKAFGISKLVLGNRKVRDIKEKTKDLIEDKTGIHIEREYEELERERKSSSKNAPGNEFDQLYTAYYRKHESEIIAKELAEKKANRKEKAYNEIIHIAQLSLALMLLYFSFKFWCFAINWRP